MAVQWINIYCKIVQLKILQNSAAALHSSDDCYDYGYTVVTTEIIYGQIHQVINSFFATEIMD